MTQNRLSPFVSFLRLAAVPVACLAVTACVPARFQVVAASQSITATDRFVDVTSVGGRSVPLQDVVVLEPDCSSAGVAVIQVQTPPSHGEVRVLPGSYYPSYPSSDSQRYACNTRRRPGTEAIYVPEPGWQGVTFTTLTITGPAGRSATRVYRVTVR